MQTVFVWKKRTDLLTTQKQTVNGLGSSICFTWTLHPTNFYMLFLFPKELFFYLLAELDIFFIASTSGVLRDAPFWIIGHAKILCYSLWGVRLTMQAFSCFCCFSVVTSFIYDFFLLSLLLRESLQSLFVGFICQNPSFFHSDSTATPRQELQCHSSMLPPILFWC